MKGFVKHPVYLDFDFFDQPIIISDRIRKFITNDFNNLSTADNAHYVISRLGYGRGDLSRQEEKERFKTAFRPKMKAFERETSVLHVADCSKATLNGYIFEYSFYKVMFAYFESRTLNDEKKQHFIPKIYLKGFASDGKLIKSTKDELNTLYTNMTDDFRAASLEENLYTGAIEELLSKVEGDFGSLDVDFIAKNGVDNLYTHIVLSAFFALLYIRVPTSYRNSPSDAQFCIDDDFYVVAGSFCANKIHFATSEITTRFTLRPVTSFSNQTGKSSFISSLNKDFVIIFLNPDTPDIDLKPLILNQYGCVYDLLEEGLHNYYNPKAYSLQLLNNHPAEIIT